MKKVSEPKFECKASQVQSRIFSKKRHDDSLYNYKIKQISKYNFVLFQNIGHPWQVGEHTSGNLVTWFYA
jgi:hypothetical protein